MSRRRATTLLFPLAILILASSCQSPGHGHVMQSPAVQAQPRTISVTGRAEISTAPDEFVVTVGVETFDKDLSDAKADNDTRMSEVLTATGSFGIEAKDALTDDFRIEPRHEGRYERRVLVGYDVRKRLVVVLRDGTKLENLLASLFERGANRLYSVNFRSSKAIEKRKEARTSAVRAAREKAAAMAAELGQALGRPLQINESAAQISPLNFRNNIAIDNDTTAAISETLATGKIKISTTVSVVFELVDPS